MAGGYPAEGDDCKHLLCGFSVGLGGKIRRANYSHIRQRDTILISHVATVMITAGHEACKDHLLPPSGQWYG